MASPADVTIAEIPGTTPPANSLPAELTGASRIKWGAVLGILGLVLAIGGLFIVLLDVGLGIRTNVSDAGYRSLLNVILLAVLAIVAGVFMAFLSFVLYTAGFASLRHADRRFGTPMVLSIIGLVGLLLLGVFTLLYALSINSALGCAVSATTCQNNATTLGTGVVPLAYGGALLGFIGLIGAIVGLYRFGSRYESTLAKVGAILYIIPVVAILAPVLVLLGAHQVQRKLRQRSMSAPPAPPAFPTPPPAT